MNPIQLLQELAVNLTASSCKDGGGASSSFVLVQPFLVHCNRQSKHRLAHKKEFALFYI